MTEKKEIKKDDRTFVLPTSSFIARLLFLGTVEQEETAGKYLAQIITSFVITFDNFPGF